MTEPEQPTPPVGPRGSEGLTTRPPLAPPRPVEPAAAPVESAPVVAEPTPAEPTPAEPTPAEPADTAGLAAAAEAVGPETTALETAAPEMAAGPNDLAPIDAHRASPAVPESTPQDSTPGEPDGTTSPDLTPADPEPTPDPVVAADYPFPDAAPTEPEDHLVYGDAPAAPAGRGRAWLPLTAVGLAVALLAGGTGWLAWQLRQQDRADEAAVDAIAAARDAARLLFSYDHTTLQADFDKGLAVTTGDFRAQYQRTTKDVVSPVAVQYKAVVKAEVVEAAVIDAQADEVTALVFLNQATTSTRVQGQQVDQSRVRLRLVPRGGRWLVEEVKAL